MEATSDDFSDLEWIRNHLLGADFSSSSSESFFISNLFPVKLEHSSPETDRKPSPPPQIFTSCVESFDFEDMEDLGSSR